MQEQESKTELFNFRIAKKTLDQFRKICVRENIDASTALRNYVEYVIANKSALGEDMLNLSPRVIQFLQLYMTTANSRMLLASSNMLAAVVAELTLTHAFSEIDADKLKQNLQRIIKANESELARAEELLDMLESKLKILRGGTR